MIPTKKTVHHASIARTYAGLAKMYGKAGKWDEARFYANRARREWLRVKWEIKEKHEVTL